MPSSVPPPHGRAVAAARYDDSVAANVEARWTRAAPSPRAEVLPHTPAPQSRIAEDWGKSEQRFQPPGQESRCQGLASRTRCSRPCGRAWCCQPASQILLRVLGGGAILAVVTPILPLHVSGFYGRRRRSDGRGASRQRPGGFARRAAVDFLGRALTASSAPRSSGATRRDRRARSARIRIHSLLLREWRHSESPWVSSCEPKRRWQCGQKTRKLSKCSEQSRADRGSRDHLAGQGAILGSFAS